MSEERPQWGSSLEFILTTIGYAVGLGSVWRFPYLVFKHGGATFLIPFFLMLFLVGIPIFFLETSIGQFSGLSPSDAFGEMVPIFKGLGFAAIIINAFIGFYYNVIIAHCLYFFIFSIRAKLPWTDCEPEWKDCFKCNTTDTFNCSDQRQIFLFGNLTNNVSLNRTLRSPSEVYFYDVVAGVSSGIEVLGNMRWILFGCFGVCWLLVFLALVKGVASLGKISYVTATFPYIILTVLVIKGALLDGAYIGIEEYIAKFEFERLADGEMWKDATSQVFFILSACSGGLISMSSFSGFQNNLVRDTFLIPILDCFTGIYTGFAIFSVLGNMYLSKGLTNFAEVAKSGPELAFIVYPEGISLFGELAPLFSVLFFIMMLLLGFGSEFSIMEAVMSTFKDVFKSYINTNVKTIIMRFMICLVYFGIGSIMVTEGGFYVLTLVNDKIGTYPLLFVGLLQVIVVPYIYGTNNFVKDIEKMIGTRSVTWWSFWIVSWTVINPIILLVVIVLSLTGKSEPLEFNGNKFPDYTEIIGWVLIAIPLSAIPIGMVYQCIVYKGNIRKLFKPTKLYYAKSLKHEQQNFEKVIKGLNNEIIENPLENKITAIENRAFIDENEMNIDIDINKTSVKPENSKNYGAITVDVKGLISTGSITDDEKDDSASTKF